MKNSLRLLTALFVLTLGSFAFGGEGKSCATEAKECKDGHACAKDCQCDKCKAERAAAKQTAEQKDAAKQAEKK